MKLFSRVGEGWDSKSFSSLLIVILAIMCLIIAKPAFAQTPTPSSVPIPTPSIPTFTVQPVGPPYTVPTTYSLNQSTGQVVAQIGYTNEFSYVVVTIKNQPFTSYFDSNLAQNILFYYNIQIKNHNESSWSDIYTADNGYLTQSDSDYTNTSIPLSNLSEVGIPIPEGTQTDIQVEAMIGYVSRVYNPNATSLLDMYPWEFTGQTSGWSNTQTVTIPANVPLSSSPAPSSSTSTSSPSSSTSTTAPTSTQSPTSIYEILIASFVALVVVFLGVIALIMRGKRR